MNRRAFVMGAANSLGLAVIYPALASGLLAPQAHAQEKRRGASPTGEAPLVDVKDPVAKAVKYIEDHTKSSEAKGNLCSTCSFYKKTGLPNGKEVGSCTIFAGKVVYGNGWCASWNKKS